MGRKQRIFPKELAQAPHTGLCYQAKVVWLPCPPHRVSPLWEQDPYLKARQMSFRHQERTIQPMPCPRPRTEPMPSPHFRHPVITVQPPRPPPRTVAMSLPHLHHQSMANKAPSISKHHVVASVLPINGPAKSSTKSAVTLTFSKQCPPLRPIHQPVIPLDPNCLSEASGLNHFPKAPRGGGQLAEDLSHLKQQAPFPSFAEAPPCEFHRTMFIAVPQTGPNHSVRVTTVPVNPGQQTLPKPRRRIRATNALLGFLKLEPMLHSAGSISAGPNHWSARDTTLKTSSLDNWAQSKRPSSSHPKLLCPWKTVSLLYCNDHLPRSLGVPLAHTNQKTRATTASGPGQLQQAGDATGPMAHGFLQMEKKSWETMPVRTSQDQGARQPPIGLHIPGKTLLVPDHQVIPPPCPEDPSHPIAQGSRQVEQEHRKTMTLRTDAQATNPTGQGHWAIPPFLGMDGQKTILFVPHYQATPPPSPNHQAEDMPGSVAYTSKTMTPRTQPQATTITGTGQDLGTVPSIVSYKQDINQPGTIPQATTLLNSDYQIGKVTNPNAQLTYQPNLELWGTVTEGIDHQNTNPSVWGYGASCPAQSTDNKATVPPRVDRLTIPPLQPEFQTEAIPDPNVQRSLQPEPKHHETRQQGVDHQFTILTGQNQGTTANPLGVEDQKTTPPDPNHQDIEAKAPPRPELHPTVATPGPVAREHREPMPPKIESQVPALTDQDLTLVSSLGVDTQDSTLHISKYQATLVASSTHQPEDVLGSPKAQVSLHQEIKQCEIMPEGTDQLTPDATDGGQGATLSLSTDDKETTFPGPDHCTVSLPSLDHQTEDIPDPNDQDSWKLRLEHSETVQPAIEQQSKDPTGKDHGTTLPPLSRDNQETTTCGPDHQDMSHLGPDHQTEDVQDPSDQDLVQPEEQMIQPGTDQQIANPTGQDHKKITLTLGTENPETILSGTDHEAISSVNPKFQTGDIADPGIGVSYKIEPENKEGMLSGRECEITTLLGYSLEATALPLGSDPQGKASLGQGKGNCGSVLPSPVPNVITSGPITDTLMTSEQGLRETKPLGTDQQATHMIGYDHQVTPPLPGTDHQATHPPSPDLPGAHVSIQKEQDEWETSLKEVDHQDVILSEMDIMLSPAMRLDLQDKLLPSPDYRATAPSSLGDRAKDTIDPIAPTWVQMEQKPRETMSLTIDRQATIVMGQDQEAAIPRKNLKSQYTAQCGPEHQATPPRSSDYWDENMVALNSPDSLQPLAHEWETISQETEEQATILMDLGFRTSPPLLIHLQDPTLPGSDYQTIPPSSSSGAFSGPDPQNIAPSDPEYSAKWLMSPDQKVTYPPSLDPQVSLLPSSANLTETRLDSTQAQGTTPTQPYNQETALLSFTKYRSVLPSGPGLQTKCLRDCGPQAEVGQNFDPQDHVQSRLRNQTQSVLNRKSYCLNYIKPYTVEGGIIPDVIVQDIISSIPQEKIKNDVYKQILLRKMRKFSPHSSSGYNSSYYPVCLLCASWIPSGCPHEGMKYPHEAQLLAIPTPMPDLEDLGVRFVLQVPQMATSSYLDFPYSQYSLQRHPYGPQAFSASSYSDLGLSGSSRPKWLHFILGKSHQPGGRNQHPGFLGEMSLKRDSPREEEAGDGRTFFKSLLERFQWRLRD
ncbi:casein kinase II subunit alpha'-interacting protein [Dromiciops gliroides]|uniref:casein kinase II subunit alpha'-interacting protein n=1 Tax=Dromiciops gliroides TaxID=33562 RepID=UPI001CC7C923|nr:casein kinase II subunit alpha'-interacting protein [Dromiciops gliroides]